MTNPDGSIYLFVFIFYASSDYIPELHPDLGPSVVQRLSSLEEEGDTIPPSDKGVVVGNE